MNNLSDLEKAKIEAFCTDEAMCEAVRKVLLAGIYSHGVVEDGKHDPLVNGAFSLVSMATTYPVTDETLGATLRGQWAGLNALENAFKVLKTINTKGEPVPSEYNEAV